MSHRTTNMTPWVRLAVSAVTFAGVTVASHVFPASATASGSIPAAPAAPVTGAFDEPTLVEAHRTNERALAGVLSPSQWNSLRLLIDQHWRGEESGNRQFGTSSIRRLTLHRAEAGWIEALDRLRELQKMPGVSITALRVRTHGAALSVDLTLTAACRK